LTSAGLKVTHNKSGANLINGIVSAILLDMDLFGRLASEVGVFEVDEFSLPRLLRFVNPEVLVLLNLSRDQLDRHWEIDVILDKWSGAVSQLDSETNLVLDKDQKIFEKIYKNFKGLVYFFDAQKYLLSYTSLKGAFNARNVNAAFLVGKLFGLAEVSLIDALHSFDAAYGRGETLSFSGKTFRILLAKNPASFNHNLEAIVAGEVRETCLLFVLNDNIPDGRDVSWIYDIEFAQLKKACIHKDLFVSGVRCLDMAVCLKYAGISVPSENVHPSLRKILQLILKQVPSENVLVLPNYSAMLEVRKVLVGRKIL